MVNEVKLLDKANVQKYLYLIRAFLSNTISATVFEDHFLRLRREDTLWMQSSLNEVYRILDSIFLDVSDYCSEEFYDPNDNFDITEDELRLRLKDKLAMLNHLIEGITKTV